MSGKSMKKKTKEKNSFNRMMKLTSSKGDGRGGERKEKRREGKGREGKGREGKGREGKGRQKGEERRRGEDTNYSSPSLSVVLCFVVSVTHGQPQSKNIIGKFQK